jgi:AmiR/NasT family two-component response regulator
LLQGRLALSAVSATPADHGVEVEQLRQRVAQLQTALDSRVAIEQARGVLMERFALTPEGAFALLRRAARTSRKSLHTLAALVTASSTTPASIERARSRA